MSTADIGPHMRPRDLVEEAAYRAWVQSTQGERTTLPWAADPLDMSPVAAIGPGGMPTSVGGNESASAIVFGAQDDADAARVSNWVQVDDLGGLGKLWCGDYGGKFYLRVADSMSGNDDEPDIGPAEADEALGMLPVCDITSAGPASLCGAQPRLPRRACPMSEREKLLKVGGRWRSDLYWDTLINGSLSFAPPHGATSEACRVPWRILTLRLVQVGEWLCFHTQITTPAYVVHDDEALETGYFTFPGSQRHVIGHSTFDARPFLDYAQQWFYTGCFWHGYTAEPPWGSDISNSWQDDASSVTIGPGPTPGDSDCPYCRVFPRLSIGEGWFSPYISRGTPSAPTTAAEVESTAEAYLAAHWSGGSPDWMEDFLGIDYPAKPSNPSDNPSALYLWHYNLEPAATPTKVLSTHIPLPDGGSVYLALHTASIDGALITACCCCPYNYWATP